MCAPKPPDPPSPAETAAAQTSTNVNTAIANAQLGNVDVFGPDGSRVYSEDPTRTRTITDTTDPENVQTYEIPKYIETVTLSPQQQAIKGQSDRARLNLSALAREQSSFLRKYLDKPFDGSNEATEARLIELGSRRLDPLLARQDEDLRARLANQGIKVGTEAYDREMELQNQARNDAYTQLLLSGNQQAFGQRLTERTQPINEITALLSGSQVNYPGTPTANQPTIPTVDYAGLVQDNYNQRLNIYNQKAAQRQNLLGGLFGLGAGLIGVSDERLKKDKEKLGKAGGHNVYAYRYKGEPRGAPKTVGVMAQEVEKKRPDAVLKDRKGYRAVNYGKLFGA